MFSLRRLVFVLSALILVGWSAEFSSATELACSCVPRPFAVAFKSAAVVFAGKVTNIEFLDDPKTKNSEARIIVTLTVSRTWKGVESPEVVLHTTENSWTCHGYYFRKDEEYLVFAYENEDADAKRFSDYALPKQSFGVSLCGGTKLLVNAENDLAFLETSSIVNAHRTADLPDLRIDKYEFVSTNSHSLRVLIANDGKVASRSCRLEMAIRKVNGSAVTRMAFETISGIGPGKEEWITLSASGILQSAISLRDTTFRLTVDETRIVAESNEDNNEMWHNGN